MRSPSSSVAGERLYRRLLRLYPRGFRDRYSSDMLAFYREHLHAYVEDGVAAQVGP